MAGYKLRVIRTDIAGQPASKVIALPTIQGETDEQRARRLKAQAAANRIRVTDNGDGSYTVTSQRKAADGTRGERHHIVPSNGQWLCSCDWCQHHPGSQCAAIAQLRSYRVRKHLSPDPDLTVEELLRREKDERSQQLEAASRERSAVRRRLYPRVEEIE